MIRLWRLVDKRALSVTALCVVVWRLLGQIPVTDVPAAFIKPHLELYRGSGLFVAIGPHSIPLRAYSIGTLGIGPYVEALVIVSLVLAISPRVREMFRDPAGRLRLLRWARAVALLLAPGSAYGYTVLFQQVGALPSAFDWSARLFVCLELTGGTAVMMLLADLLDEYGLGFGYGAFLLYALASVGAEAHQIAGYFATTPSTDAFLKPFVLWAALTIGATAASVAIVLALRRVGSTDLRVLVPGVFRPPSFASAVMFLPVIVANYYTAADIGLVDWFRANFGPYGPSFWLDAVYLAVETALIMLFAVFVATADAGVMSLSPRLFARVRALAFIAGAFIAMLVVWAAAATHYLTLGTGQEVPMSGFEVLLVVVVILVAVRGIEGRPLHMYPSLMP